MSQADKLLEHAPSLRAARTRSLGVLDTLRQSLQPDAALPPGLATVLAAGSLSRLELGPGSDLDAIIIADADVEASARAAMADTVYTRLAPAGLALPKADGIYRQALTTAALLSPTARGSLDEDAAVFGQRIQFLLDVRALFAPARASALRAHILDWYTADLPGQPQGRATRLPWQFLLADLGRYRHAYAVWQGHKLARSASDSWQLRQIKLGSSRLLTFTGLTLLLGDSLGQPDAVDWVAARLDLTPLERVAEVMRRYDSAAFAQLLRHYENIHARLSEPGVREELVASGPDQDGYREPCATFRELAQETRSLGTTLTGFLLDRRDQWPDAFFAALVL